jgi:hypothetical protein
MEGEPSIRFDLAQLSPRLCSSWYVSKVLSRFCVLSRAKMQRSLEQRYAIKFCAKLGKSGSETMQLLRTAYGDAVLSSGGTRRSRMEGRALRTNSTQGILQFQKLRTVAHVKAVLDRDRRLSVQLMAEEVGLPKTDVH